MNATINSILIVGPPGAGKSRFARKLSARFAYEYINMDELRYGPGWTARPEFRQDVERLTLQKAWVADSASYPSVAGILWSRAQLVIFLDLSRGVSIRRLIMRTALRLLRRTSLWNGNRESLRLALPWITKVWFDYEARRMDIMTRAAARRDNQFLWLRGPREVKSCLRIFADSCDSGGRDSDMLSTAVLEEVLQYSKRSANVSCAHICDDRNRGFCCSSSPRSYSSLRRNARGGA
jgi:adenylate kinase family enzyme